MNNIARGINSLTLDHYQFLASSTAIYPSASVNGNMAGYMYPALGLCGEVGEVCEKLKKAVRDDSGLITDKKREEVSKEIGDVLWYLAALCNELQIDMGSIAQANLDKLASRKERGVLGGSGDNR